MSSYFATCRFCREQSPDREVIKYGVRHYAHPVCLYLLRGIEALDQLQTWQLRRLPALLLMKAGVPRTKIDEWMQRVEAESRNV